VQAGEAARRPDRGEHGPQDSSVRIGVRVAAGDAEHRLVHEQEHGPVQVPELLDLPGGLLADEVSEDADRVGTVDGARTGHPQQAGQGQRSGYLAFDRPGAREGAAARGPAEGREASRPRRGAQQGRDQRERLAEQRPTGSGARSWGQNGISGDHSATKATASAGSANGRLPMPVNAPSGVKARGGPGPSPVMGARPGPTGSYRPGAPASTPVS
jgi:hypothetical protein